MRSMYRNEARRRDFPLLSPHAGARSRPKAKETHRVLSIKSDRTTSQMLTDPTVGVTVCADNMTDPSSSPESYPANDAATQRPWRSLSDNSSRQTKGRASVREIVIIVVCVLDFTWALQTFVGRQYVISSESMEH